MTYPIDSEYAEHRSEIDKILILIQNELGSIKQITSDPDASTVSTVVHLRRIRNLTRRVQDLLSSFYGCPVE